MAVGTTESHKNTAGFISLVLGAFVLSATCLLAFQQHLINRSEQERLVHDKGASVYDQLRAVVSNAESVSRTLAFIVANHGVPTDFDEVARNLIAGTPYFAGIELLDSGTISHIYPYKGNEKVLGYNVLADSNRNQELLLAISEKRFHFAGPFDLKQGGVGMVGRYPIFKGEVFVGIAAVIIRWEALLSYMRLGSKNGSDFDIQLYKTNLNNGENQPLLSQDNHSDHSQCEIRLIPEAAMELHVHSKQPITLASEWPTLVFGILLASFIGFLLRKILLEPQRLNKLVNARTQALQESQNLYRNTLLRISDGFMSIEKNGSISYLNQQAASHFHLEADKMIGKNALEYLGYLEGSGVLEGVKHALITGENQHFEAQKPTDFRWYSVNIYPSNDGVSVFATDITHEKEAVRLLELTNEVARIGGWEYISARNVFNLSPMARQLLRMPDSTTFKEDDLERYFGVYAQQIQKSLQKLQTGEGSFTEEVQILTGDDRPFWVRINARVTVDAKAKRRIYGTIQDIEFQKLAQEVIAGNARRYRSLFDLNPLPMWTFSWESLTIIDANRAACDSYGYDRVALLGQPVAMLWQEDGFTQYLEDLHSKNPASKVCKHIRKNGQTLQVELILTQIEQGGGKAELMLARDITERLAHLRAIEGQNSRLREIAWMQSHQVRAPLARIMAIIQLLALEPHKPDGPDPLHNEIIRSAHELDGMLAEIIKRTELSQFDQV